jgi:hypothetical protein
VTRRRDQDVDPGSAAGFWHDEAGMPVLVRRRRQRTGRTLGSIAAGRADPGASHGLAPRRAHHDLDPPEAKESHRAQLDVLRHEQRALPEVSARREIGVRQLEQPEAGTRRLDREAAVRVGRGGGERLRRLL